MIIIAVSLVGMQQVRIMCAMRRLLVLTLANFTIVALGVCCAWDNDTLSAEVKGQPKLLDAIMGRVAYYPPEYYQFRIRRSTDIVKSNPNNLEELDNLIVAHDKLKSPETSYLYLALKRKALDKNPNKEHEYRYWANLGTVEAHEWWRSKERSPRLLESAITHLEKCVAINPDAHFGREIVQIAILKFFQKSLDAQEKAKSSELSPYDLMKEIEEEILSIGLKKFQKGVLGMMSLGGGPDSPELLRALSFTLSPRDGHLKHLISYRLKDLKGEETLLPKSQIEWRPVYEDQLKNQYQALVADTNLYRKSLHDYVLARLANNKHPDNDPLFWSEWKEPKRIDFESMESFISKHPDWQYKGPLLGTLILLMLSAVALLKFANYANRLIRMRSDKL